MVFVQKWPFFQLFFYGNIGQENVLYDTLQQKTNFLGYKNKKFKKSENWHFSKNGNFSNIFFSQSRPGKCLLPYFTKKRNFLGYKNKKFKQSTNWHFPKGDNPWFWSINGHYSNFFFFGTIGQKKVFYDILERKKAFGGYKNKKVKKSKNWHFSKGVNPWS